MARPSKFTGPVRAKILEALGYGASRTTAAAYAGIDDATLGRWIKRGKEETEGPWHDFHLAVLEAEAAPKIFALRVIRTEMETRPELAWKFVERREPGFAPPQTHVPAAATGPVVINLAFPTSGPALALAEPETVIEVGTVEQDVEPGPDTAPPA